MDEILNNCGVLVVSPPTLKCLVKKDDHFNGGTMSAECLYECIKAALHHFDLSFHQKKDMKVDFKDEYVRFIYKDGIVSYRMK